MKLDLIKKRRFTQDQVIAIACVCTVILLTTFPAAAATFKEMAEKIRTALVEVYDALQIVSLAVGVVVIAISLIGMMVTKDDRAKQIHRSRIWTVAICVAAFNAVGLFLSVGIDFIKEMTGNKSVGDVISGY